MRELCFLMVSSLRKVKMRNLPNVLSEILPYEFMWKQYGFETWLEGRISLDTTLRYWWVAGVTGIVYLIAIIIGQRLMRNRKPFDLKIPLAAWNLMLSIGSAIAFVRLVPYLIFAVSSTSFSHTMCHRPASTYLHGAYGFWSIVFLYSKFAELIDTAFLVLRKKDVPLIHWFHHLTVLCYCWDAYRQHQATGYFFVIMNVFVHSIMYFYYFLAAISRPPKWGKIVTNLQIAQMFMGCFLVLAHSYYLLKFGLAEPYQYTIDAPPAGVSERSLLAPIGPPASSEAFFKENGCNGELSNLAFCTFIYSSYLFLFVRFSVQKYKKGSTKKRDIENQQPSTPLEEDEDSEDKIILGSTIIKDSSSLLTSSLRQR